MICTYVFALMFLEDWWLFHLYFLNQLVRYCFQTKATNLGRKVTHGPVQSMGTIQQEITTTCIMACGAEVLS